MPISEKTYEQVALEDGDDIWELDCGRLRAKPGMTWEHGHTISELAGELFVQLDRRAFRVDSNGARLRISTGSYYVPDVAVIARAVEQRLRERLAPGRLEVYEEPLPLVVEVWSPSTGNYDVDRKLREYQWRGVAEIWRLHPYERTVTAWRRRPDGSYGETLYREGTVEPIALPGVRIDLEALFAPN
jgi:Uma2 family endonuclease